MAEIKHCPYCGSIDVQPHDYTHDSSVDVVLHASACGDCGETFMVESTDQRMALVGGILDNIANNVRLFVNGVKHETP